MFSVQRRSVARIFRRDSCHSSIRVIRESYSGNTPYNTNPGTACITHAAHPLRGQRVAIRQVLYRGGEVYFLIERPDGRTQIIPRAWTDQAPPVLATAGAPFTPAQLQALRRWRDAHLDKSGGVGVSLEPSHCSGGITNDPPHGFSSPGGGVEPSLPPEPPTPVSPVEPLGTATLGQPTPVTRRPTASPPCARHSRTATLGQPTPVTRRES